MSAMSDLDIIKDDVFITLDRVRESGKINMFGAAPYIQEWFGLNRNEARFLLNEWMRTFNERHPA
jgi:hypothetical protein